MSEEIIKQIRRYGKKTFYCHGHVDSTSKDSIFLKDELTSREFVKRQGLNLHEERNSHGARILVVTM